MSKDDDGDIRQEHIPKGNTGDQSIAVDSGKNVATTKNLPWIVDYALNESFIGLQIQKRKTYAQKELFEAVRLAQEELTRLEETSARLENERILREADYATKGMEIAVKTLQLSRDQNRLLREIQEEKDKKELLAKQKEIDKVKLDIELAELNKKKAALGESAKKADEPVADSKVDGARESIRRYMERNRDLGADKKKWFAQIDADLARGELSEETAENMKEDIEQMIRDSLLKP